MQVDENHDGGPRSSGSDQGDSDNPFQLSAKLMNKMYELEDWRIDPSSIEFPDNTCQFRGGHATVSRVMLDLGSDEGSVADKGSNANERNDTNERHGVEESENTRDGHGSHSNARRVKAVAVKMMRIEDPNGRERVLGLALREADFLAELDHKNIVKLEGFVVDLSENRVWLIFPWEENGNLKDFAASRDWEIPERIWLIEDVARGVEYLHGRSPPVYHGDLKSVNILVTSKCRALITDFGSARRLAPKDPDTQATLTQNKPQPALEFQATFCASTNTMTLTGNQYTLRWAAPELLNDDESGLWSDIWALGWIFYEVMTNSIPFQDVRKDSIIIKHVIDGKLPSVTKHGRMSLIITLCSLMIKCWSINPCERPTAEDCRKLMSHMPMVAPDPQRTPEMGASGGRSPKLLITLGYMYTQQDDYTNASKNFTEAVDMYTQMGDIAGRADALDGLAEVHYLRDEHNEALSLYSETLEIYTKIGHSKKRARALDGLARVYEDQNEYTKAATFYSEAAQIFTNVGDRKGRAFALHGTAQVYRFQAKYSKAVTLYSEVAEICADIGEWNGRADALWGLAEVHRLQNEYIEAAALFSEAFQIYTDMGNRYGIAHSLLCLAQVHRDQDHHSDAIRIFEEATEKFEQIGNTRMAADASTCAASVRRKLELWSAE